MPNIFSLSNQNFCPERVMVASLNSRAKGIMRYTELFYEVSDGHKKPAQAGFIGNAR